MADGGGIISWAHSYLLSLPGKSLLPLPPGCVTRHHFPWLVGAAWLVVDHQAQSHGGPKTLGRRLVTLAGHLKPKWRAGHSGEVTGQLQAAGGPCLQRQLARTLVYCSQNSWEAGERQGRPLEIEKLRENLAT